MRGSAQLCRRPGATSSAASPARSWVVELVRYERVSEARIDRSVHRLLREKFLLGLFDQPLLDVDHAVATIGRADFVAAGEATQRAAIVRLTAAGSGSAALPLAAPPVGGLCGVATADE